jgi:endonuclease/exonuclease/phosphatase family metal-dependent hydrolase
LDLRLLTWNSFGAAQDALSFLRWRGVADPHRFEHPLVHEIAARADVLCMQEVYLSEAEQFFDGLGHDHKLRDSNELRVLPLSVAGSGLGVASRLPIARHGRRTFSPPYASAERFARKGMLHARVRVGETYVDVVNTHMQSGMGVLARMIRKGQLLELRRFVDDVGASGVPIIVCGDFNIDGLAKNRASEYAELARTLPEFTDLGAAADHVTFDSEHNTLARKHWPGEPPQRLDYTFVCDPSGALEIVAIERAFHVALECASGASTFASDHYAVETRFTVR